MFLIPTVPMFFIPTVPMSLPLPYDLQKPLYGERLWHLGSPIIEDLFDLRHKWNQRIRQIGVRPLRVLLVGIGDRCRIGRRILVKGVWCRRRQSGIVGPVRIRLYSGEGLRQIVVVEKE